MTGRALDPSERQKTEAGVVALVAHALEVARRLGATAAEVSAGDDVGFSVDVRDLETEAVEFHHDKGIGITVYRGERRGSASTSDTSADAIEMAVGRALNIAKYTAEDEYGGLPDVDELAETPLDLDLVHPWAIDVDAAVEHALRAEKALLDHDVRSDGASLSTHTFLRVFGNSLGFLEPQWSSRHSLSAAAIAEDGEGMHREGEYTTARRHADLQSPEWVGDEAAARARARVGRQAIELGRYPVVFAPSAAGGLVGHVLGALSGGAQYRKASFLLDALGERLAPAGIEIKENPHLLRGPGSTPFDGDGVATSAKSFVADGIVASYILGTYSARRLGLKSTGNAGGVFNAEIEGTRVTRTELLELVPRGLLVESAIGQGVNAVTGDYSRGVKGFWFENGEIKFPVDEVTIASNLRDMWANVVALGDDVDRRGNIVSGSILIDAMMVGA